MNIFSDYLWCITVIYVSFFFLQGHFKLDLRKLLVLIIQPIPVTIFVSTVNLLKDLFRFLNI